MAGLFPLPVLDASEAAPLYRQLSDFVRAGITNGRLRKGDRLPPTRELAERLGVNRATVSAAYALLESEGWIEGHVGRGSFVRAESSAAAEPSKLDGVSTAMMTDPVPAGRISFATSRPAAELFPLEEIQGLAADVLSGAEAASVLQLGSPAGYAPLRRYLRDISLKEGVAGPGDDILITSGCQQAVDLAARSLASPGDTVLVEDPVYPGLRHALVRAGVRIAGVPVNEHGLDLDAAARLIEQTTPRLMVVTPNFQNPTGLTLNRPAREQLCSLCERSGVLLVENDIYGPLRYRGEGGPTLKQLAGPGKAVLLRSYSKIAFPGLRVGWIVASHSVIETLVEAKQWTDLHSDQLSQAILLRFEQSGGLASHVERIRKEFALRLEAALEACARHLPPGSTYTKPEGGMSLWVRLPRGLDATALLPRVQAEGVDYLPGRFFGVDRDESGSLRLSFAGIRPDEIRQGVTALGRILNEELAAAPWRQDAALAMV